MIAVVIDASVIGPLLLPDERAGLHPRLRAILAGGAAVVPQHWHLEVANLGLIAVRRNRVDAGLLALNVESLAQVAPTIDGETSLRAWGSTSELAAKHRLTIYDAAYLELAMRRNLPLLSTDGELRDAAVAEGVALADA